TRPTTAFLRSSSPHCSAPSPPSSISRLKTLLTSIAAYSDFISTRCIFCTLPTCSAATLCLMSASEPPRAEGQESSLHCVYAILFLPIFLRRASPPPTAPHCFRQH